MKTPTDTGLTGFDLCAGSLLAIAPAHDKDTSRSRLHGFALLPDGLLVATDGKLAALAPAGWSLEPAPAPETVKPGRLAVTPADWPGFVRAVKAWAGQTVPVRLVPNQTEKETAVWLVGSVPCRLTVENDYPDLLNALGSVGKALVKPQEAGPAVAGLDVGILSRLSSWGKCELLTADGGTAVIILPQDTVTTGKHTAGPLLAVLMGCRNDRAGRKNPVGFGPVPVMASIDGAPAPVGTLLRSLWTGPSVRAPGASAATAGKPASKPAKAPEASKAPEAKPEPAKPAQAKPEPKPASRHKVVTDTVQRAIRQSQQPATAPKPEPEPVAIW